MTHYLLAAEANKIQDFIFRSAHLREVLGGSQLLKDFCETAAPALLGEVTRAAGKPSGEAGEFIVNDGGSFTVDFVDKDVAERFSRALPDLYNRITGGTLTVAPLVLWSGEEADFASANQDSRGRLNLAKRAGGPPVAGEHLPYAAYCASCGMALADAYVKSPDQEAERGNYMCPTCRKKAEVDVTLRDEFCKGLGPDRYFEVPREAERTAVWDSRGYVAYIIADGNGMGATFRLCRTQAALKALSAGLTEAVMQSLGVPAQGLIARADEYQKYVTDVPTLPLIVGGDDVFVRIPAPYALDFALRFCQQYEDRVGALVRKVDPDAQATVGVAVVICKAKYPHYLAHRYGESLLKEAKQLSKQWARQGHVHSCVNFGIFLGSRLAEQEHGAKNLEFQPSLKPYWISSSNPDMGLSLDQLIAARSVLRSLPRGRLAQLEELFAADKVPQSSTPEATARWQAQLERLLGRVASRSAEQHTALKGALTALGGDWLYPWRKVTRPGRGGGAFYAHGLPDLLDTWDYALDMSNQRADYLREEER